MSPDLSTAERAARSLLGWEILHTTTEGTTSGYIVETEAYSQDDPASHTFKGRTKRNDAMFRQAGTVYIYFTYGMHYCANIVAGNKDDGQGVLIRSLQPVQGVEIMQQRRQKQSLLDLTNGPAKLVQAMGITMENYGDDIFDTTGLWIRPGIKPRKIKATTRIGIKNAKELKRRYYIAGNPFVSKT